MIKASMTVSEMKRNLILEILKATNDNRIKAAEMLGISIRTLKNEFNE